MDDRGENSKEDKKEIQVVRKAEKGEIRDRLGCLFGLALFLFIPFLFLA